MILELAKINEVIKFSGFDNLDPGIRAFILISVALAYPAWDFGFDFGVYDKLFFDKIFVAWSISTALLITLIVIPKEHLQIPRMAWAATAIPTVWLLLVLANWAAPTDLLLRKTVTLIGFLAYLACFPYVIYMALAIAYPEFLGMRKKGPAVGILLVILFIGGTGYLVGSNHTYLLTCRDFEVSGSFIPTDCRRRSE